MTSKWSTYAEKRGLGRGGSLPPSCGTDRHCHCENKHACWGCRPVWLVPGLSPCPLIPRCLWSLCCCLATGSIFLSSGGASGCSCRGLIYRRKSPVWVSGGSQPQVFISTPRLLVAMRTRVGVCQCDHYTRGCMELYLSGRHPLQKPQKVAQLVIFSAANWI